MFLRESERIQDGSPSLNTSKRRITSRLFFVTAGLCAAVGAGFGATHVFFEALFGSNPPVTVQSIQAPFSWMSFWGTELTKFHRVSTEASIDPSGKTSVIGTAPKLKIQKVTHWYQPAEPSVAIASPKPKALIPTEPVQITQGASSVMEFSLLIREVNADLATRLRRAWVDRAAVQDLTEGVAQWEGVPSIQSNGYPKPASKPVLLSFKRGKPSKKIASTKKSLKARVQASSLGASRPAPITSTFVSIQRPEAGTGALSSPTAKPVPAPVQLDWKQVREQVSLLKAEIMPQGGAALFSSPLLLASNTDPRQPLESMTTQDVSSQRQNAPMIQLPRGGASSKRSLDEPPTHPAPPAASRFALEFVEALSPTKAVHGASSQPLSNEGTEDLHPYIRGWQIAEAADHWPSLVWVDETQKFGASVPLLGKNDAIAMAGMGKVQIQDHAAIVHGRIDEGFEVALSGRAEPPIYVNLPDEGGKRFFAFFNVEPGTQVVTVIRSSQEITGVGVPTLSGMATSLDLANRVTEAVRGQVIDASQAKLHPIANVSIQAVGIPHVMTRSSADGTFVLQGLTRVVGYPVYLDSNLEGDFTYRTRWLPQEGAPAYVFRYRVGQIQFWLQSLQDEGGLAPESGMIVAALPGLSKRSSRPIPMFPSFRALGMEPSKPVEAYALDRQGNLEVQKAIAPRLRERTLTVQVPSGPGLVVLEDASGKPLWSELCFSSPGVIQMIGPY